MSVRWHKAAQFAIDGEVKRGVLEKGANLNAFPFLITVDPLTTRGITLQ